MGKRVDEARRAYDRKDIDRMRNAHDAKAIQVSIQEGSSGGIYIGDLVYGALDGLVTTFAVVSGVAGASLSSTIVIILGIANLLGDGFSMAVGNYLGTKSENEYIRQERRREEWEIDNYPAGEKEEIRAIFRKQGFKGRDLERAVKIITSDKKVWIDTMMFHELGLIEDDKDPLKSALATFLSFVLVGFLPLLPFVLGGAIGLSPSVAFPISLGLTFMSLFAVGALRVYVTKLKWWKSGLEMLFVGGFAAAIAYLVGFLLRGLV